MKIKDTHNDQNIEGQFLDEKWFSVVINKAEIAIM
jgi:hypothetical protein